MNRSQETTGMARGEQWLVVAVFALLLVLPALAGVLGMRATTTEHRALATAPGFDVASLVDADYYAEVSRWIKDRMALRGEAIALDAHMDLEFFDDSPDPQVWLGRDGWLFFDPGLRGACAERVDLVELAEGLRRTEAMLRDSGREIRWMVVPNKVALYPEHATADILRAAQCGEDRRSRFQATLESYPVAEFLDLHTAFRDVKARFDPLLFYPDDSHITPFGTAILLHQLVNSLTPGLWDARALRGPAPQRRQGDLARMIVARGPIEVETFAVQRPGVSPGESTSRDLAPGVTLRRLRTIGPEGAMISVPTFVLHDSQFNIALSMMRPYFGDVTALSWKGFDPAVVADEMASARIVVMEVVERDLYWRGTRQLGSDEFQRELARSLAER